MASTSKCPYCGGTVSSNEKQCPNCGAANALYVEDTPRVILSPHTIEELQEYCAERGMPLLRMRFFIGEDFKEPKAFGIYKKSNGDVVVYKNKADGARNIRYEGPDEEHGVTELYLKLLEECHNRGIYPDTPDGKPPKKSESIRVKSDGAIGATGIFFALMLLVAGIGNGWIVPVTALVVVAIILFGRYLYRHRNEGLLVNPTGRRAILLGAIIIGITIISITFNNYKHPYGYYHVNGTTYYHISNNWYVYDENYGWSETDNYSDAHDGGRDNHSDQWNTDWGDYSEKFENSSVYKEYQDSHRSSSDYDNWDSGDTDWDSDW